MTSLVHGVDATEKVIAASAALFGQGELSDMDEATLRAATQELHSTTVDGADWTSFRCLVASGLSETKSAARRTVGEGGAYINNVKYSDLDAVVGPRGIAARPLPFVAGGRRTWLLSKSLS